MSEIFQPLNAYFSTADVEAPTLTYDRGSLHVRYRDWQEREIQLTFRNVAAFSWDDGEAAVSPEHRDDTSYLVSQSNWIHQHIEVASISSTEGHCHYKLCFNAVGVLQVIATDLEVMTAEIS